MRLLTFSAPLIALGILLAAGPTPPPTRAAPPSDCAAILPDAEVARVCRVPSATGDASTDGSDGGCIRAYTRPDAPDAGLVFVVNPLGSPAEASATVQVEALTALASGGRPLDGLGDGGVARTISAPGIEGLGYVEHAVTFSAGATVVSLRATQIHEDRPALCTLDEMVTLARGIAGRIG